MEKAVESMADVEYEIIGDDMQAVEFNLKVGQKLQAEAGAMLYLSDEVNMDTSTGGGIMKGIKRAISGESFFITTFECTSQDGEVAFAGPYPGKVIPLQITPGNSYLCQRDSFLCSTEGIDITVALTKRLGAGFFGGEGFILQKLEGQGLAFTYSGGTVIKRDLGPGQSLRVDTGCLVAFQDTVDYDIKRAGGVKTMFFGGEGLFLANLSGPGTVYLQTLPFSRLADRIMRAANVDRGEKKRGGGGLLGNLASGDSNF